MTVHKYRISRGDAHDGRSIDKVAARSPPPPTPRASEEVDGGIGNSVQICTEFFAETPFCARKQIQVFSWSFLDYKHSSLRCRYVHVRVVVVGT